MKVLHWLIAYIAVSLSASLAAWSGMEAATEPTEAYMKGAIMFLVAILGCHGWGWAARTWANGHRLWAIVAGVVLTMAMLVTLIGGAGSFYSAANTKIAAAERGSDAYQRADAELKRIDAKRKALTKHRTKGEIEPDIEVAKADRRFKATDGCNPAQVTRSLEFCKGYQALQTELAAAEAEEKLDEASKPYQAIVAKGKPASAGASGALLATVPGIDVATGYAAFAIMCTIALDMGAVVAVLTAELRHGHPAQPALPKPQPEERGRVLDRLFARRRSAETTSPHSGSAVTKTEIVDITPEPAQPIRHTEPPRLPSRPKPKLAASTRRPVGAVLDFLHEAVDIVDSPKMVEMSDAYIGYAAWCRTKSLRFMEADEFFNEMADHCAQFGIPIREEAGCVYLGNVQLAA